VAAYRFSKDLYEGENRLLHFIKDLANEEEDAKAAKYSMPAQIVRSQFLLVVFLPVSEPISDLS
jgi:hypothetical protein